MKFVLFVEGHTEHECLQPFLKRWLDARLTSKVGIQTVKFNGWGDLVSTAAKRANRYLNDPASKSDIIAVISLLDLYMHPRYSSQNFFKGGHQTAEEKFDWGRKHMQDQVSNERFRQYFAVHEIEAWLLSDPTIFPDAIQKDLRNASANPEMVNSDQPPKKLLEKIYTERLKTGYKERVDGSLLFDKLNPETAYQKCPHLKMMLDDMLGMAKQAGQ